MLSLEIATWLSTHGKVQVFESAEDYLNHDFTVV